MVLKLLSFGSNLHTKNFTLPAAQAPVVIMVIGQPCSPPQVTGYLTLDACSLIYTVNFIIHHKWVVADCFENHSLTHITVPYRFLNLFFLLWNCQYLLIWYVTFLIKGGLVLTKSLPNSNSIYWRQGSGTWTVLPVAGYESLCKPSEGPHLWAGLFPHQLIEEHLPCT